MRITPATAAKNDARGINESGPMYTADTAPLFVVRLALTRHESPRGLCYTCAASAEATRGIQIRNLHFNFATGWRAARVTRRDRDKVISAVL